MENIFFMLTAFFFPKKKVGISMFSFGVLASLLIVPSEFLLNSGFYCDYFSKMMALLLFWLFLTIFFFLEEVKVKMVLMNSLGVVCTIYFFSKSIFPLFVFFELSIFPILVLILGWGAQPERVQAGFFMLLYTLLCSSPLILMTALSLGSGEGELLWSNNFLMCPFETFSGLFFCIFFLVGFLSKIPIFLAHIWLPKAHVEATLEGSMVLAGVLLKLGVFGVVRIFPLFVFLFNKTFIFFFSVAMVGSVVAALIASSSDDMKMIVAYASVSHMNILIISLFTQKLLAKKGSIITCFSHGLGSSLLFFTVYFVYSMTNSRSIILNKSVLGIFPILVLIFLLGWVLNLSVPPSFGFWGELFSIIAVVSFLPECSLVLLLYFLASSFYSMFSFGVITHSSLPNSLKSGGGGSIQDYICSLFLIWPLFLHFSIFS